MNEGRPVVCLLREAGPDDAYVQALEARGFRVVAEPVLQFTFVHAAALRDKLRAPESYSGLVLTSPRAVEALRRVREGDSLLAPWCTKPVFVVGPKTASEVATLGFAPLGQESGSAEALAAAIARHGPQKPLLFLSGNRRRDVLPERLTTAGIVFDELVVYETHPAASLDVSSHSHLDWLVVFSPSALDALRHATGLDRSQVRLVAIGPTTAEALTKAGWTVAAVAAAPTPEAVVDALVAAS